ncbi:MAG: hypothetical protein ACREIC_21775, partial [Limisphaerales bacterium]
PSLRTRHLRPWASGSQMNPIIIEPRTLSVDRQFFVAVRHGYRQAAWQQTLRPNLKVRSGEKLQESDGSSLVVGVQSEAAVARHYAERLSMERDQHLADYNEVMPLTQTRRGAKRR